MPMTPSYIYNHYSKKKRKDFPKVAHLVGQDESSRVTRDAAGLAHQLAVIKATLCIYIRREGDDLGSELWTVLHSEHFRKD